MQQRPGYPQPTMDAYTGARGAVGGQQPPSYNSRSPYSPRQGEEHLLHRTGILGFWYNLTAPKWPDRSLPTAERERFRKAELTSLSILAVAGFLIALVSNSLADPSTAQAVLTMAVGLVIAAVLNRTGAVRPWRTNTAAIIVPALMMVLLMAAVVEAKGGLRLIWFPAYDLLALPIFISSLTSNWRTPWIFALVAMAFIIIDFTIQPHAIINGTGATNFDDIAFETHIWTSWGMVNRHLALSFFAALVGSLGARSVTGAIRRADRAEELAQLEHEVAEQRRQLEIGVQELLSTHVRAANGDFSARAPMNQGNALWQVSASLNNLLARLQKTGQSEFQLKRTDQEIDRLADALLQAREGRRPIWPAPTGTRVDRLLDVLLSPTRQPPMGHFPPQMGRQSAPRLQGNPGGQPGWENPWQSAPSQAAGNSPFDTGPGGQWGGPGPQRGHGEE